MSWMHTKKVPKRLWAQLSKEEEPLDKVIIRFVDALDEEQISVCSQPEISTGRWNDRGECVRGIITTSEYEPKQHCDPLSSTPTKSSVHTYPCRKQGRRCQSLGVTFGTPLLHRHTKLTVALWGKTFCQGLKGSPRT